MNFSTWRDCILSRLQKTICKISGLDLPVFAPKLRSYKTNTNSMLLEPQPEGHTSLIFHGEIDFAIPRKPDENITVVVG